MRSLRFAFRVLVALASAAAAFLIGTFLPLFIYGVLHGDPGMPGGAGLGLLGFWIGLLGAPVAGMLVFERFTFAESTQTSSQLAVGAGASNTEDSGARKT
jgi:hypothetical protein